MHLWVLAFGIFAFDTDRKGGAYTVGTDRMHGKPKRWDTIIKTLTTFEQSVKLLSGLRFMANERIHTDAVCLHRWRLFFDCPDDQSG